MHVANMASYTFGREAFVAAEAEVHFCFVAEAEGGPKAHFERHSAPKPNFSRSLLWVKDREMFKLYKFNITYM